MRSMSAARIWQEIRSQKPELRRLLTSKSLLRQNLDMSRQNALTVCKREHPTSNAAALDAKLAFCGSDCTSVASSSLHFALQKRGTSSRMQNIQTAQADGRKTIIALDTFVLPVKPEGRELFTEFIVWSGSEKNRTFPRL